jgi:hypothetical protein
LFSKKGRPAGGAVQFSSICDLAVSAVGHCHEADDKKVNVPI